MSAFGLSASELEVIQQVLPTERDAPDDSDLEETQQVSSTEHDAIDVESWGFLFPLTPELRQIDFERGKLSYRLGRHAPDNDIVLTGINISKSHCTISWNGKSGSHSEVIISDTSRNGTFINDIKIGNGREALLRQGDMVSLGFDIPGTPGVPLINHRFIYCHRGADVPVFTEYEIGHELGRGTFATVFRATHKATGEVSAVKLINTRRLHMARDHMIIFMREIEILTQLQHPNIVVLKEVLNDQSNIALVMEFLPGGNLLDYIIENEGIAEPDALSITRQMCEAMSYIHKHKIAHRDLKPENVLLTNTIPVIVKIADFGLAKAVDHGTFLKTMCGTPNYLAPEIVINCKAHRKYNDLVDSWSMGVMVFSMLTNMCPFIEKESLDMETDICNRTVEWSILKQIRVSCSCFSFVHELLKWDPRERMSLSDALNHPWLSGMGIGA